MEEGGEGQKDWDKLRWAVWVSTLLVDEAAWKVSWKDTTDHYALPSAAFGRFLIHLSRVVLHVTSLVQHCKELE